MVMMPFPNTVKEEALVRSRRCCCICNEFAGLYTNVHHIIPENQGGSNTLDNAIVLCLRCHGEVGHYYDKHPIGNKYSATELIKHRDNWWQWCETNPSVPLPKNPISVSPSSINFRNGEWLTKSLLNIYNKENQFYYQVWVKIGIESDAVQFNDIGIELVRGHDDLKLRAGFVEMSASICRMHCIDEAGKRAIFLIFNSLEPHGIYTFEISQLKSYQRTDTDSHCLRFTLSSFSLEPQISAESSDKAYFTFTPPENFKALGLSLLLRRI
jgi:hypothetical protein